MITLKAALIAASAIGTVAVGGGATWAMTGSTGTASPQSHGVKAPAAERKVQEKVPGEVPTCLPGKAGLPKTKLPATGTGAKNEVEKQLKQNPATKDLPDAKLPKTGVKLPDGSTKLPDGTTKLPDGSTLLPDGQTKLPANLPTCAPSTEKLAKAPAAKPGARVPAKPGLPAAPKLDCSKLAPAVKVGSAAEKAAMLSKGLRYASTVPGSTELRKQNICAVTQKWTGTAGQWITVETLKTPAGMTQNQLRQAMNLPQGGTPITVSGAAGWTAPGGNGLLLFDPNGHSLFLNGSPVLAGGLQDVAAALRQAR